MGLKLAEQIGEDNLDLYMCLDSKLMKVMYYVSDNYVNALISHEWNMYTCILYSTKISRNIIFTFFADWSETAKGVANRISLILRNASNYMIHENCALRKFGAIQYTLSDLQLCTLV